MASLGIDEPLHELLCVSDPFTNGIIYCMNRQHLRTKGWKEKYLPKDAPIITVYEDKPFASEAFTHDSWVDRAKTNEFVDMLIDFACLMHSHLKTHNSVVVHCKNGYYGAIMCMLLYKIYHMSY